MQLEMFLMVLYVSLRRTYHQQWTVTVYLRAGCMLAVTPDTSTQSFSSIGCGISEFLIVYFCNFLHTVTLYCVQVVCLKFQRCVHPEHRPKQTSGANLWLGNAAQVCRGYKACIRRWYYTCCIAGESNSLHAACGCYLSSRDPEVQFNCVQAVSCQSNVPYKASKFSLYLQSSCAASLGTTATHCHQVVQDDW